MEEHEVESVLVKIWWSVYYQRPEPNSDGAYETLRELREATTANNG